MVVDVGDVRCNDANRDLHEAYIHNVLFSLEFRIFLLKIIKVHK